MLRKILILMGTILVTTLILFLSHHGYYHCIIKSIFHISCAGCGLTRSIVALFHGQILKSLHDNILTIPLLCLAIWIIYLFIRDIIKKTDECFTKLFKFWQKYYLLIIILILFAWLCNNIHHV